MKGRTFMGKAIGTLKTDWRAVGSIVSIGATMILGLTLLIMIRADAKESRKKASANEMRITRIETKYARFEGIMDERTKHIHDTVNELKTNIQTLLENLELAKD